MTRILGRILSFFGIDLGFQKLTITLIEEEREGGYSIISSPELKGFSLMLEPAQLRDFRTFIDAIHEPLITYAAAYCNARDRAEAHAKALRMRGLEESKPKTYRAQLAAA
jgi:hypothetical protein